MQKSVIHKVYKSGRDIAKPKRKDQKFKIAKFCKKMVLYLSLALMQIWWNLFKKIKLEKYTYKHYTIANIDAENALNNTTFVVHSHMQMPKLYIGHFLNQHERFFVTKKVCNIYEDYQWHDNTI